MMNNPFGMLGNQQNNGPFNNLAQMINQYNQFRNTFQGDPKQQVQDLINSGQMSQEQFNQLSSMAQMFQSLIRR